MTGATDLNIETNGQGLPIILTHGVGDDTRVWEAMVPVLAGAYRVIAWDQPGHGRSAEAAEDAYGPRLAYDSLSSVAAPYDRVVLVGHSLGGYLSARYTIEHPERVAALVLIATGPGFRSPDAREKWNADVRRSADRQGRPARLVGLHEDSFVMDHLADLTGPSMIIVGSEDAAFLGATDYIQKKVPAIERVTVEGAGHGVPSTHGAQLGVLITAFLERHLA